MNIILTQTPPPPRFDSYRPVNLTEKIRPAPVFPGGGAFLCFFCHGARVFPQDKALRGPGE